MNHPIKISKGKIFNCKPFWSNGGYWPGFSGILSIQPMTAPSGMIFYLDYMYGFKLKHRVVKINKRNFIGVYYEIKPFGTISIIGSK